MSMSYSINIFQFSVASSGLTIEWFHKVNHFDDHPLLFFLSLQGLAWPGIFGMYIGYWSRRNAGYLLINMFLAHIICVVIVVG